MRRGAPIVDKGGVPMELVRPYQGRWIAGVCVGIADRFGISPGLVRLLFVVSCLLPGPQFLIYAALWLLVPKGPRRR